MSTWREVFAWGDVGKELPTDIQKHIQFFLNYYNLPWPKKVGGDEPIEIKLKTNLKSKQIHDFIKILGEKNVSLDVYDRLKHSYGKFYGELLSLRQKKISRIADAVLYPSSENQILKILKYCTEQGISVLPFGGGTSVTMATQTPQKGVVINISRYLNRILELNRENHTVRVQAGILGPQLEKALNEQGFTCGHFPQSFEFSTVGGWIAARGAGQASTGYGPIEELLLALRVVTPQGILKTKEYPRSAIGPDLKQIFIGSEGAFGIISEATLKIFPYRPDKNRMLSFFFPNFSLAVQAMREILQAKMGFPHFFRISDGEETQVALLMKNMENSFVGKTLNLLGYKPGERCLMYATLEGEPTVHAAVSRQMKKIARSHKGIFVGGYPTRKWLSQRFSSAYMRDPLMDAGVRIDTIETSTTWDNLLPLHQAVRQYIKAFEKTFCLGHISHAYETGANLYFVYVSPMRENEAKDFSTFHEGLIDVIVKHGGCLSHHHGIGRLFSGRLKEEIGDLGKSILGAIKKKLDPEGILNPGVLGL